MAIEALDQTEQRKRESKRDAFLRLAERRTNAVLDKVRVLSNCANPYAYEYTDDDVKKIFAAIERELRVAKTKFQQSKKTGFTLR
ncbi:MAG: hypothetical protein ACRDH9_03565 [Actinomycetota bacterium]